MFSDIYLYEGFSVSDRRSQPCTTEGGAEEPLRGIEKPRSSIDVTDRRSVKSTEDESCSVIIYQYYK